VGGCGVATIFDTQTGIPFSPTTGADSNHDGDTGDRAVVVCPVQHRGGKLIKTFSGATPVVNFFSACKPVIKRRSKLKSANRSFHTIVAIGVLAFISIGAHAATVNLKPT
jgi:hypothetical protein